MPTCACSTATTANLARFDITKPSLSAHLAVLSQAGLIQGRREANRIHYGLVGDSLVNKLNALMQEVCPVAGPLKREARARRGGVRAADVPSE